MHCISIETLYDILEIRNDDELKTKQKLINVFMVCNKRVVS